MATEIQAIDLHIPSQLFKPAYCLYAYSLRDESKCYGYIGITGDRKEHSARSPIRRLAAHLDMSFGSTQNQLTRGVFEVVMQNHGFASALLRATVLQERHGVRNAIMNRMAELDIRHRVYPLLAFDPSITKEQHKQNRRQLEALERLAVHTIHTEGVELFNDVAKNQDPALPAQIGGWNSVLDDLVMWFKAGKEGV